MTTIEIQSHLEIVKKLVLEYSPKVVVAILLLLFGLWGTSFVTKTAKRIMMKRNIELTLSNFIGNVIFWTLRIVLFVTVISKLGIETSSFVAILGAAGLAVGLSLQGSLSNFAGGILIILFKPFKVGDTIEAHGTLGTVKEIQIFSTIVTSPDNKQIIIPNGLLSNGTIINYSTNGIRRVDLIISVGYDSDLQLVKNTLHHIILSIPEILKEPETSIFVNELATSSIDFAVRPYAKNENILLVKSAILEKCKLEFDKVGIEIPYPHQVEISKSLK
jgi:small conductance mechanosensitive channel